MIEDLQKDQLFPVRRLRNYGAGVLVVLLFSLGIAVIVYVNNIIPFQLIHLLVWIFGPLGVFTCLFALFAGRDRFYYLIYGVVMVLIGLVPVTYSTLVPVTLIGVLLIVLAVIGAVAYWRGK